MTGRAEPGANPYILVVESDADLQRRIGEALREARYELGAETELAWARRSLALRRPDAVVLDTALSNGTGFELAREVRRDKDLADAPIFFIASRFRGASHTAEMLRRFAPAEVLPVPLDMDRLLVALLQRVPPRIAAPPPAEPPPAEPPPKRKEPTRKTTRPDGSGTPRPADKVAGRVDLGDFRHVPIDPITTIPQWAGVKPPAPLDLASDDTAIAPMPFSDEAQLREKRDVERRAKDLAGADAELRGSLKRTSFARVLQRLYARRATGALLLLKDATKKIVFFVDGYPVSVRSNVLSECLGQLLLERRLISADMLAESLALMKAQKKQQGAILVEMGALSPFNLERALADQMEQKLFEVFSWRQGKFTFKEGGQPPSDAVRLERSTAALIYEGVRRHYDGLRLDAVLAEYAGKYLALAADPVLRLQEMTSDPTELSFIYGIDGTVRFETALDRAAIPREKARLILAALAEARMIEPAAAPLRRGKTDPRARTSPTTGVGRTPRVASPPVDSATPILMLRQVSDLSRAELGAVLDTMLGQNHFDVLGVPATAAPDEIAFAYDKLAREYHPDRFRGKPDDVRRVGQEIFERLTEANRVLGDTNRRKAYAARLEKSRPADGAGAAPPFNPTAERLYREGIEHLRARRHREAVDVFRQAARLVPSRASYRAALGWALFREAPADARAARAALGELRRAIQLDGHSHRAHVYLGYFYAQTGKPDSAVREFETALSLKPGAAEIEEELRRLRGAETGGAP